jgi:queuine/archaeosine tRNA-ribosyltransferase
MSKKVLISMLKQGETGNDILMILDAITESDDDQPTLNEIEF